MFQAPLFVVLCQSNPRGQIQHPTRSRPWRRGVKTPCPQPPAGKRQRREGEGAGEAGPGRGAADVQFSLASRAGLGDPLARWPGLLGTALPRALCLRQRGDDHRTARRPFTSPTPAASPPSSPRLPQGPLLGVEAPARLAGIGEN